MKNIGGSIVGIADTENRKIKFSAFFMFGKNTSMAKSNWSVAAYESDGITQIPEETSKLSISSDGVLSYADNVSTGGGVYIKVFCVAYYPDQLNREHIDYWFRFVDLLG